MRLRASELLSRNALTLAAFLWVAMSSALTAVDPAIGLATALAPFALYLIVAKSWARVAVVVGGGMVVFGSSSDVGPQKVIYAGALLLCTLISALRLIREPPAWGVPFKPLVPLGAILLVCLFLGTIATPGQDLTTVLRQSIGYVMVPLAPIIGIDVGRDVSPKWAMRWIAVLGCISAIGGAADWLNRRGVSSLGFGRFISGSIFVAALAFALAIVMVVHSRGMVRVLWMLPILIIPAPLLVSGTRTNLILFLAIVGVLGSKAKFRLPPLKVLVMIVLTLGSLAVLLPLVANAVISQPGFLDSRIQALFNVANGDFSDQSYALRNEQYYYAAQWISESPWFGKGPGFNPPISMDTPLATVVKIGLIGTIALVLFLLAFVDGVRRSAKAHGYTAAHTAISGVAIVFLADLPFGSPIEDRGFFFTIILALMGVGACLRPSADSGLSGPIDLPQLQVSTLGKSNARAFSWSPSIVGAKDGRSGGIAGNRSSFRGDLPRWAKRIDS